MLCLIALPARADAGKLYLFAAASLQLPLEELTARFEKKTGGKVVLSPGASGDLARQIEQGAPAGLFISANSQWMDYLQQRNLLLPGSRHDLLGNRLAAVISPCAVKAPSDGSIAGLLEAYPDQRIAMGNPDTVPAGAYARQALTALGLWLRIEPRLVYSEDVRAAAAFVARCETGLGFIYESDASPGQTPGLAVAARFPETSHPKIVYPMAIIAENNTPLASKFSDYLRGAEARAVFASSGFVALE